MRLPDKMNASCLRTTCRAVFPPACLCAGLQLSEHQPRSRDNNRLSCGSLQTANGCFAAVASTPCQPQLSRAALRHKLWVLCRDAAAGLVTSLRPSLVGRSLKPNELCSGEERRGTETQTKLEPVMSSALSESNSASPVKESGGDPVLSRPPVSHLAH